MKLSEKIIERRKKLGLSQVDLADILGVSRQSVSKWETDEAKPEINKLPSLAKALNVSIDYLLSEEEIEDENTNKKNNSETVIKAYPDWVEKLPSFLRDAIKKYGWIYGIKIISSGALFTIFGIVARIISYNFIFGGNNENTIMFPGNPIGFESDVFSGIKKQSWMGFSTLTGLVIGIGLIMLIGGTILTIVLKRWSKEEK